MKQKNISIICIMISTLFLSIGCVNAKEIELKTLQPAEYQNNNVLQNMEPAEALEYFAMPISLGIITFGLIIALIINIKHRGTENLGLKIISFLIPLVGFAVYITTYKKEPEKANQCGKYAIVALIVPFIYLIISIILRYIAYYLYLR